MIHFIGQHIKIIISIFNYFNLNGVIDYQLLFITTNNEIY